ncbi:MAG: OmpA family protein [Bacteroidales bacterium]|nr:OmpA family protein [Bacteroidales bacterium]
MKRTSIFIIAALLCLTSYAQTKKADKLFDRWEYYHASKLYEKEAERNPSADIYFKLGECYRKMNLYKEQLAAYDKVNAAGTYSKPEFYLNYGQALKNNGKYDQAKVAFNKYHELMPSDPRGKFYSASIDIVREDHQWDEPFILNNVASLNTSEAEFSPVMHKDGLTFTTSRKSPGHDRIYARTGGYFLDIYHAKKGENDSTFVDVEPFGGKNIYKEYHGGPASFTKNFDTIYFSRVEKDLKGKKKKTLEIERNKIFMSTLKDGNWTETVPFALNNDVYSVANPFISPDGSRLYFVSDMPGGYGETDIYYCNRENNGWGRPINMGPNINTFNREKFPSMDAEGNFYFASDGYQGFGGLDICVALKNGNAFDKARPMKYPFNSYTDDFSITFLESGKTGYIASNRYEGGQGDDDIYYFNLKDSDVVTSVYTIGYRPADDSDIKFWVNSPGNIPSERRVKETFPLRNYIFFDLGSTEIPSRYILLSKNQVSEFKEDQLEVYSINTLKARSKQQMIVYYNVLNILGDRMGKNPSSTITLVGSSEKGPEDGKLMAESVRKYLTDIFSIKASRIKIEGRSKPKLPSEQPGGELELELLRQGDRRVSIESGSPALLMEFQSGPEAPLKPVTIITRQEAPLDSYVTFHVEGAEEYLTSWSLEIMDEQGTVQKFGPYSQEVVSLPGKSILNKRLEADYKVTMVGQTKTNKVVTREVPVHMALWTPPTGQEGMRFSVIYEFNDSKSIRIYEKYLTEIVAPLIPDNATVNIHGYTDIIGTEEFNQQLSLARARDAEQIIKNALSKSGRKDVKFEVFGFGEDESLSQFDNNLPEERFYNRTVIIDIVPGK